jgi:hypothetical protein
MFNTHLMFNKFFYSFVVFFLMLMLLVGCGSNQEQKKIADYPKDKESCEAANGVWGPIGLAPYDVCNIPTSDGGKLCYDSSECDGYCLADLTPEMEEQLAQGTSVVTPGECSDWTQQIGCIAFVESGRVDQILCID